MTEVAIQSFEHVGRELNVTLGEARAALESYVEQPENVSLLNRTAAERTPTTHSGVGSKP